MNTNEGWAFKIDSSADGDGEWRWSHGVQKYTKEEAISNALSYVSPDLDFGDRGFVARIEVDVSLKNPMDADKILEDVEDNYNEGSHNLRVDPYEDTWLPDVKGLSRSLQDKLDVAWKEFLEENGTNAIYIYLDSMEEVKK